MLNSESEQSAPSGFYFRASDAGRCDRAVDYSLTAAHGWEFLLDNHLETDKDRRRAVKHAAVLGEN